MTPTTYTVALPADPDESGRITTLLDSLKAYLSGEIDLAPAVQVHAHTSRACQALEALLVGGTPPAPAARRRGGRSPAPKAAVASVPPAELLPPDPASDPEPGPPPGSRDRARGGRTAPPRAKAQPGQPGADRRPALAHRVYPGRARSERALQAVDLRQAPGRGAGPTSGARPVPGRRRPRLQVHFAAAGELSKPRWATKPL